MIKWDLFTGCKDSSIFLNQLMRYATLTDRGIKIHMIVLIDTEKALDKI